SPATSHIYPLSLHDALPISEISCGGKIQAAGRRGCSGPAIAVTIAAEGTARGTIERCNVHLVDREIEGQLVQALLRGNQRQTKRSEEHTSELQSRENLVCRL